MASVVTAIEQALEADGYPFAAHTARVVKNAIDTYLRQHPTALMMLCEEQGIAVPTEGGWEFVSSPLLDLAEPRDLSDER